MAEFDLEKYRRETEEFKNRLSEDIKTMKRNKWYNERKLEEIRKQEKIEKRKRFFKKLLGQ